MTLSVTTAIDTYVDSLEEVRQPDGYWHPSGLFGCPRKAVYDFLGTPKPALDARTKRVFRMGHVIHEFAQAALAASPDFKVFLPEVKIVDDGRFLKGHADGLGLTVDGEWVLIEIKSIKSTAFKYASDLPKEDHRKQTSAYVSVLRYCGGLWKIPDDETRDHWLDVAGSLGWDVDSSDDLAEDYILIPPLPGLSKVVFIYISKDDFETAEFVQEHTDQKEAWLEEYLARLDQHVTDGTLPKRLEPNGKQKRHYQCGYCPFAARCWNQDGEGVE